MSCLTTLKLTSASSRARRISRSASSIFSSVSLAWPRRLLKARCSFSCKFSNIRMIHFSSGDGPLNTQTQLFHFRPYHLEPLRRASVLQAAHAAYQVERIAVQSAIFEIRIVDVNGNYLANHQAAAGR